MSRRRWARSPRPAPRHESGYGAERGRRSRTGGWRSIWTLPWSPRIGEGVRDPDLEKNLWVHPLLAYADHGDWGTGEPLAGLLRPGNAGSNTATDHLEMFDAALAQLPSHLRATDERGRRAVLVRTDAATYTFTHYLAAAGVEFSVGAYLHHVDIHTVLTQLPEQAWIPAYQV